MEASARVRIFLIRSRPAGSSYAKHAILFQRYPSAAAFRFAAHIIAEGSSLVLKVKKCVWRARARVRVWAASELLRTPLPQKGEQGGGSLSHGNPYTASERATDVCEPSLTPLTCR